MRVWELGSNVELEIVVVRNNRVSQLDDSATSLLEGLFEQDGLQSRIQLLSNILQEAWLAKTYGVLKTAEKVLVSEFHHIHCIVLFLYKGFMKRIASN